MSASRQRQQHLSVSPAKRGQGSCGSPFVTRNNVIASLHGGSPLQGIRRPDSTESGPTAVSTFNYRWDTLCIFLLTACLLSDTILPGICLKIVLHGHPAFPDPLPRPPDSWRATSHSSLSTPPWPIACPPAFWRAPNHFPFTILSRIFPQLF